SLQLSHFPSPTPTPPHPYSLSLHDALPISSSRLRMTATCLRGFAKALLRKFPVCESSIFAICSGVPIATTSPPSSPEQIAKIDRSEEHTSELQSPDHLVCRLLLEKKKKQQI